MEHLGWGSPRANMLAGNAIQALLIPSPRGITAQDTVQCRLWTRYKCDERQKDFPCQATL